MNEQEFEMYDDDAHKSYEELRFEYHLKNLKQDRRLTVAVDLLNVIEINDFKDFVIKIDENEFKAHKLMLAARSPTLAEMIKNNPDADELILTDIDVETFKIILEYIYEDEMPENYNEKSVKIFAAAEKLKLESLKQKVGDILCEGVNPENSFEMLKLAFKYNLYKLKKNSFEQLKKLFPDKNLKDELIDDHQMLESLIGAKKDYDEKLRQMKEEFDKFLIKAEK